jgi:hypothetical protein
MRKKGSYHTQTDGALGGQDLLLSIGIDLGVVGPQTRASNKTTRARASGLCRGVRGFAILEIAAHLIEPCVFSLHFLL